MHSSAADKGDDMKDCFYEELECVFNQFPLYHMQILLGDFNTRIGREGTFKQTIWSESLHENSIMGLE
jgi:hypothetical protein